jgi:hypothetical protein
MSYGFLATNNNSEVLVSSETRNLHFLQKRTSPSSVTYTTNLFGGMRHWVYNFTNVSIPPVPFFSTPTPDYYAVTRVTNTGGSNWTIEVIRSGTSSTVPEVYLFADPRAGTATDAYGMIVYRDDGSASFDSRKKPLAVTGGQAVSHPTNPKSSYSSSGLNARYCRSAETGDGQGGTELDISNFNPDQYNSYSVSGQPSKPIFSYLSLAQAERELTVTETEVECDGIKDDYLGCIGFERTYYFTSTYFAFYRGGISWDNGTLKAGWIITEKGCNWTYDKYNDFLGIGTGGDSGTGGNWPYSNETINTANNTAIIANGARYD